MEAVIPSLLAGNSPVDAVLDLPDAVSDGGSIAVGSLSVLSGAGVTLWGPCGSCQDTQQQTQLCLAPDRPVIIGRAEGGEVPYLDPAYQPTTVMPGTGKTILHSQGHRKDLVVSRGHFMLRAAAAGILLTNGVPRRGGGIRPPMNGTWLVASVQRALTPGEHYLIDRGMTMVLWLPNGSQVQIEAA